MQKWNFLIYELFIYVFRRNIVKQRAVLQTNLSLPMPKKEEGTYAISKGYSKVC